MCVCWGQKKNICDISTTTHLQGRRELASKPTDYLGAPQGLPSLLHKPLQLNTSNSLAHSFSPRFWSRCYAFILHRRPPSAPLAPSHFSLCLLTTSIFYFFYLANLMLHSSARRARLSQALTEKKMHFKRILLVLK